MYPHWTQYEQLRPRAAPLDRCSARTARLAQDPFAGVMAMRIGGGSLSAPPLALPLRLHPQLHSSSRRMGAMGSARAGQLRGGANCCSHCGVARALSPSPEPMPAAAPELYMIQDIQLCYVLAILFLQFLCPSPLQMLLVVAQLSSVFGGGFFHVSRSAHRRRKRVEVTHQLRPLAFVKRFAPW